LHTFLVVESVKQHNVIFCSAKGICLRYATTFSEIVEGKFM